VSAAGAGGTHESVLEPVYRDPVYLFLGNDLEDGDRLRLQVLVEGEKRFTQELELIPHPAPLGKEPAFATPVVELFPARPERLAALERKSRDQRVEIAVYRNGELLLTASLTDLLRESETLRAQPFEPKSLRFEETRQPTPVAVGAESTAPSLNAKGFCFGCTCLEQCDWEQDRCYQVCDNFNPGQACYDRCDQRFLSCQNSCGGCQPSTSTSTQIGFGDITVLSPSQCHHVNTPPPQGSILNGFYDFIRQTRSQIVTTTTHHADCTQTVTTTVTSLPAQTCWRLLQLDSTCSSLGAVIPCT
jgi:hypothetical protein